VRAMHTLRHDFWAVAALAALLAGLSGCGKAEHAGAGAPSRPATRKPPDAAELALANIVSAVGSGKASGDIELKFDLRGRPVAGEPVDIDLAVIPTQDLDRLYAMFQPGEGLELTKGGKLEEISHPPVGVAISHTLTIVPQRDGVFYVSAVVLADSATESVTRSYSIPLIAGAGVSATAAPETSPPAAAAPAAPGH
jgi:hypothetical protein